MNTDRLRNLVAGADPNGHIGLPAKELQAIINLYDEATDLMIQVCNCATGVDSMRQWLKANCNMIDDDDGCIRRSNQPELSQPPAEPLPPPPAPKDSIGVILSRGKRIGISIIEKERFSKIEDRHRLLMRAAGSHLDIQLVDFAQVVIPDDDLERTIDRILAVSIP